MVHVALDTSILRKDPRLESAELRLISYLARHGSICLHIPNMVEREFSSFVRLDQKERLTVANDRLRRACSFPSAGGLKAT